MNPPDGKPPLPNTLIVDANGATLGLPPASARSQRRREVPAQFGRYEVRATLGTGGMGAVYLAYDSQLDRLVALKVPHLESAEDPDLMARFRSEAQAAAGISHPNLCTVYDAGEIDGIPYLTMTYVRGRPLTDLLIKGQPLPQEQAAMIIQQVAAAMDVAHRAGIIHRDLKPANIILGEHGAPVVMDFGVARRESVTRRRLTFQGTSLGTPGYMAPETLRGDANANAPPCDIYSLGVTLYQLLTARLPFVGTSPVETVRQVLRGDRPRPVDELIPGIAPQLVAICHKAMAARVDDRYPSMGRLADALVDFLRGRNRQFQVGDDAGAPGSDLSTAEVLSRAGERLFTLGRWDVAYDVISTAAELPGLDTHAAVRQRNRLVHLCKNRDRWTEALGHSQWCVARLAANTPPELAARVYVNLGSVLYDLGRRSEASEAFHKARQHAETGDDARSRLTLAAACNNLGVAHHYGDELTHAETVLAEGRGAADEHPILCAYLDTNLGLVQLTRALLDSTQMEAATRTLGAVVDAFTAAGHLQGVSYALSNRALCDLAAGRLAEARAAFEETIRLGERLGEKWSVYGAQANLALVELARPGGDASAAFAQACNAAARAAQTADPKGVADASLIAARAALETAAGGVSAHLPAADTMLEDAAQRYARLGQRLGEALACLGRMEIAARAGYAAEHAAVFEKRARAILATTELAALPLRFIAPPWHMLFLMELF